MNETQVFVTLAQLAKRLNLPKAWLHREAIAGRIPSIKAGPVRRFNVAAVAEAINATGQP
jgi:excisionase family DNA binding protein